MKTVASRSPVNASLAILAAVLIVGAGFCLFDSDGHDHAAVGLDLCTGILAVAIVTTVLVRLGVAGATPERPGWAPTPATVAIPDPPPWR
jgi:hypothetical protein